MNKIVVKTVRGTERLRRAGYAFGREPIELDIAKLKKGQIVAIRDEPLLEVTEVADDDAAKKDAAEKASAKKAAAEAAEKEAAEKAAAEAAAAKKSGKK